VKDSNLHASFTSKDYGALTGFSGFWFIFQPLK